MGVRYIAVADSHEVQEGKCIVVNAEGEAVVVCRVNRQLFAVQDLCSHDDGPLGDGFLDGFEIECPRHGARFDVRDGAVKRMPAAAPIRTYPLKTENGKILIGLDDD